MTQGSTTNPLPIWAAGLTGKVALVTGAGRGLGRACAEALYHAGANVIAVARTASDLDNLREQFDGPIETWVEDATSDTLLHEIEGLGQLDILVNNAGTNRPQPFLDVEDDALNEMLNLNVRAAFRVARSAARVMVRGGNGGSIINMSSQMGHVGSPRRTVYCMTKHAIEGLTKAMAVELGEHAIRVNSVAPTFIDTPLTRPFFEDPDFTRFVMDRIPLNRLGTVEEVAAAVVYLAAPASGIVTGSCIKVDGGWTAH
ncbi:MAG: SDR family oxidoreductase [Pseudomonadota bacterium]